MGVEECSHLPLLQRLSVPAAEAGGRGMPLPEDNTACFLILPVPSPLESLFSPPEYYFLLFLSHVAALNSL